MIDHITFHVFSYEEAKHFYTKVLETLGYKLIADMPQYKVAGYGKDEPEFWIAENRDKVGGQPHVGFVAENKEQIHTFYDVAMSLGAKDNGLPGPRPEYTPTYYAAFVLSPDGHNIEAAMK
jgi:catechol 2,3-dioxygenase-like lactoylglutathione lyase family enzyme